LLFVLVAGVGEVPGVRLFTLRVGTFRFTELFKFRELLFTAEFPFEGLLELLPFLFAVLPFALLLFAFLVEFEFLFLFLLRSALLSLPEVSSSPLLSSAAF
jgi:hypothetical protein